jgi:lysophospholipase L1-like esterase
MVFLGSSSFHGANTSQDEFKRISDIISVRILNEIPAGHRQTVVNRAISADTLANAYATRMETDVWSTKGIQSVVVWVTNDLEERSADEIIENYRSLITDAHSRNVKVYCPTWLPSAQSLQASLNGERMKLNDWILNSGECDGIADYNAAVEAPGGLTYLPQYNGGDFIHSNDAGHAAWAEVTPISDWILSQPAQGKP